MAMRICQLKHIIFSREIDYFPAKYVHCCLGWGGGYCNGWYINGVFDTRYSEDGKTHNIPWADADGPLPEEARSVGNDGVYKFYIKMLTGIRPCN